MNKHITILVMGLPGAGKTTFADRLHKVLPNSNWINADVIRGIFNDWDFSVEGRIRQAHRMKMLDKMSVEFNYTVIDFVCPLEEMRTIVDADIVVWMDTIKSGRYEDTNVLFIKPDKYNYRITSFNDIEWSNIIQEISLLR